jgi:WD40 repeat protein
LVFSSDGRVLASGSDNTAPVLWDLNGLAELEDDVLQRSCRITGGGLDRTEWARHLPELDYVDVCGG